jgi:hypothetical protein
MHSNFDLKIMAMQTPLTLFSITNRKIFIGLFIATIIFLMLVYLHLLPENILEWLSDYGKPHSGSCCFTQLYSTKRGLE